jgi:hypothetical protein
MVDPSGVVSITIMPKPLEKILRCSRTISIRGLPQLLNKVAHRANTVFLN